MREQALDPRSAREAELVEVLSSYVEPRAVSYRFVVAFALLGLLGCVGVAWAASQAQTRPPIRFEPRAQETLARGIAAFERGQWDESERLLVAARESGQVPTQRLEDYLERLALVRRDSERLMRAEEALEVGEPERALALTALIAANSALFPQAELLGRAARARAEQMAAKKLAAQMDVEAARQASPVSVVRSDEPDPSRGAPPLQKKKPRREPRPTPSRPADRSGDADW
jgi:hypothetical protein